jgi:hypothetical protein
MLASGPPQGTRLIPTEGLATQVPKLTQARVGDDSKRALAELLSGYRQGRSPGLMAGTDSGQQRGDLARTGAAAVDSRQGARLRQPDWPIAAGRPGATWTSPGTGR